jgi:hypothetical protein
MPTSTTLFRFLVCLALPLLAGLAQAGPAIDLVGFKTRVPDGWQQQPPENTMRAAQFLVPAARGQEAGQSIVFYFGKGQGGSVDANIARWESNFSSPAGKPVKAARRQGKVAGMPVTWAELNGAYARGVGMGMAGGVAKPDQTLLVGIVETPKGNLTFQLFGPRQTVAAQRKAFEAMISGLK